MGGLSGLVTDARGIPQMGAAVALLAVDGRVLHRLITDASGSFLIERLKPGNYNLRVTLANFLPVFREHVLVQAGGQAFLSINLASLSDALASLAGKRRGQPESDEDWKWVIRSSGATRPVLRLLPGMDPAGSTEAVYPWPEPHARLEFLGGGGRSSSFGSETDFSTGFGYSQSLFHGTTLLLGGNVGYQGNAPATAFRSVVQKPRADGSASELSLTVRQVFLPGASLVRSVGRTDNLQATAVGYRDEMDLGRVRLEYGGVFDTISFLDRLSTISSFGRATLQVAPGSDLLLTFNQGIPRQTRPTAEDPLREVTSDLSLYPRMSMRDGSPAVQRGRHVEAGFQQKVFSGTLQVSAYRDDINNWAIAASAGDMPIEGADFLPDALSQDYSYNAGNYRMTGARVSYQHRLGRNVQTAVGYSYGGMLVSEGNALASDGLDGLRNMLRIQHRQSVAMKMGAGMPWTRTHILVSYKWIPGSANAIAGDLYDQTAGAADPSLNVLIRQPLPQVVSFTGRLEALADFRNLLAQGYVPITSADGRRVILLQNVRSFRGGLSFNF